MGVNLSGLINAGTQALGTYEQSKAQAGQQQIGAIMQAIAMQRQQAKDDLAQAVAQSTIGKNSATVAHLGAQTAAMANPKPKMTPHSFMVDGQPTMGFADPSGKFYDGTGQLVTGKVSPFVAQKPVAQGHVVDPVTGEVKFFDPTKPPTGLTVNPKPQKEPQQSYTPFQGTDDQGKPVVRPFNTKTGQFGPAADVAPKAAAGTAGAMSGQTMQTMARMGTSYNDLKQAIDQMDQYENTPGNLAKQTPGKQSLGAVAETHPGSDAHGLTGAINNGLGAYVIGKAGEKIGQDDPEYRTYLNNKQRVATAFTELLPRPNQALLQLEKGLSGADVSWNPTLIRNIQARRRGGLDVLKNILGSQGMLDGQGNMTGTPAGGGRGRGGAPPSTGNIDLRDPSPAKPAAKPAAKKDYGIFTPPGDE